MARWNLPGITAANTAGYSVSMSEFNSASCGGAPGISDTFGSAMWAIDYSLQLASLGYGSSYIHTREAGISYNLFEPPPAGVDPSNSWSTGPSYHSVLVVAEALHNPKAPWAPVAVVDLNADNSMLSPQSTVAAYAIYPSPDPNNARKPPIRFLLFNYALNGSTTFQYVPPPLSEGQTWTNSVNVKYLTAESVTARFNISWAGQILSGEGKMTGNLATTSVPCNQTESCAIPVPGPGVALVFLDGGDLLEDSNGTSTGGNNGGNENTSGGGGGGTGQDPNQEGSGTVGGNNGEMDIRLSWWTAILGISLALAASLTSLLP
ncbi:hypothetical protein FRC02_009574 [Tulasnella sp. 418]|nr:hypothetical protein FRC02_009574 [Tulasnella sp. 418]